MADLVVLGKMAKAILGRIAQGETTLTVEAKALGLESYGVLKKVLVKVCGIGAYAEALEGGRKARQYPRRGGGRKKKRRMAKTKADAEKKGAAAGMVRVELDDGTDDDGGDGEEEAEV